MRIRSVRPEFWSSEDIAKHDIPTRLLFIGLWSYVDDNGVGRDVEKLINADLFPLADDPRASLAMVKRGLQSLSDGGQITRYTVEGKPYLHVTAWDVHQRVDRPGKERYPLPTRADDPVRETLATPSRDPRETPAVGEGEKGRRGEGDVHGKPTQPSRFDEFWAVYPNKKGKIPAEAAWKKLMARGVDPQDVINGAKAYRESVRNVDKSKVKMPQGWLNDGRWEDEIDTPASSRPRVDALGFLVAS